MGTMHGFADTVRFHGRGLIVDRAVATGHNRIIRGGAVMPFTSCSVSGCRQTTQTSSISFWCVTLRTRCERCHVHKRTCVQQSHAAGAPTNNISWLFARGVQCVDWVERSFFVFEHRCLRCFALAVERHRRDWLSPR